MLKIVVGVLFALAGALVAVGLSSMDAPPLLCALAAVGVWFVGVIAVALVEGRRTL